MEIFKERVTEYSQGTITVDHFPGGQLGGAMENVDQVRTGATFATYLSIAFLTRTVPELEALSMPFVFTTREQAFRVIDGQVGRIMAERLAANNFHPMGYFELGFRHTTNNVRPIRTMDDFRGLRIRLQPNEVHLNSFRALGASPISMDISELYQALQQGVIDGQENPYSNMLVRNFDEVQRYLTNTSHFYDLLIVVANKSMFDRLTPAKQDAINRAMTYAVNWQRVVAADEDDVSLKALIDRGMQFNEVTPEFVRAMQTHTAPVIDELKGKLGADLINTVLREAGIL
jgi:tripartite ATP-independent transporter DctP family solute receptor